MVYRSGFLGVLAGGVLAEFVLARAVRMGPWPVQGMSGPMDVRKIKTEILCADCRGRWARLLRRSRALAASHKWAARVGETQISEKVNVSLRRTPLLFKPLDLNGGPQGFELLPSQVPRLRTKISMAKTRGALAAKNNLCFTRTGRIFFWLAVRYWGSRVGFGASCLATGSDPSKLSTECRRPYFLSLAI